MKINELSREQLEKELKARCIYCKKDKVLSETFTAKAGEHYHIIDNIDFIVIYADDQSEAPSVSVDEEFKEYFERYKEYYNEWER